MSTHGKKVQVQCGSDALANIRATIDFMEDWHSLLVKYENSAIIS